MTGAPFQRPFDPEFLLGTDTLGRDILSGIVHGARVSLLIGFIATTVAVVVGVILGALAGYYGGIVDDLLMRFTEFFQTIPSFVFAVVLVAIFTPEHRLDRRGHRHRQLAGGGAAGARRVPDAAHARVRAGRGRARPVGAAHHLRRDPAQRRVADHRVGLADGRDRDPDRIARSASSASATPT